MFVCIGVIRQCSGVPPGSSARSCSRQARGRSGFEPWSVSGHQCNRHSLYPLHHRHSGALQFIGERFILWPRPAALVAQCSPETNRRENIVLQSPLQQQGPLKVCFGEVMPAEWHFPPMFWHQRMKNGWFPDIKRLKDFWSKT